MKKAFLPALVAILLAGCVGQPRFPVYVEDGLYLRFEVVSPGPMGYTGYKAYTFKQIAGDKYQVTIDSEEGRQTRTVGPDFRDFDQPLILGPLSGPAGGYLWISPYLLVRDTVEGLKVAGTATKEGYQVYKVTDGRTSNVGYYEKTTGFQVAYENFSGDIQRHARLVKSNAKGLNK